MWVDVSKYLHMAPSVIPTRWLFKQKEKRMLYHSITLSTITLSITMSSSSGLKIAMANLQEAIQRASVNILEPLHTAQMTSGSTKMETVQELYCITVSIPNIFIDTWSNINTFHRRNGLPPYGGSWPYQMWRSTCSFQSHTPCSASAQSWVWPSIILLLVQSWMQNTLVMLTLQSSTLKVWQRKHILL